MTRPQSALSPSDSKILHAVFDPESAPETPRITIDPSLPPDAHISSAALLSTLRARELAAVKVVEKYAGSDDDQRGKSGVYEKAKALLDTVIAEYPFYASAWNNRAQLRRWRCSDAGGFAGESGASVGEEVRKEARRCMMEALEDLDRAIALASPPSSSPDKAVSPAQGKLLAQAWTQRAAIFWGTAKALSRSGMSLFPVQDDEEAPIWSTWDKTRFEEEGSRCFFMAGLYGSEIGRAMAVLSNPTAKLCGNIVKEAMRGERGERSSTA